MGGYLDAYFDLFRTAAEAVARERMQAAADAIIDVVARGGTIFSCGNGGSAAIANHLACDCLKGVRTDTTIKPRVSSLSATVELITAIANDIGYDDIFSYQLTSLARPGDVLHKCDGCDAAIALQLGADQSPVGIVTRITTDYAITFKIRGARTGTPIAVEQTDLRIGANYSWNCGAA
jgi:hypothetical protein